MINYREIIKNALRDGPLRLAELLIRIVPLDPHFPWPEEIDRAVQAGEITEVEYHNIGMPYRTKSIFFLAGSEVNIVNTKAAELAQWVSDFLDDKRRDPRGLSVANYCQLDDDWWEICHGHIQWAFPLPEASAMQPDSPVVNLEFYDSLSENQLNNLRALYARYREFLAFTAQWASPQDHNHLRITRVIRCLTLANLPVAAKSFYDWVVDNHPLVPSNTRWYWREALNKNPAWLAN